MTSFVPLKVFQDQKLHEDSQSYQNLEEYLRRILPIKSRLEDSVKSRRITKISEPQESENPRTRIPWAASNVPAKDGRKRAREESGSAEWVPPKVGFHFLFSHVFLRLYIATVGLGSTHPVHYQGVKTATREGQQLEASRGSRFQSRIRSFQILGSNQRPYAAF